MSDALKQMQFDTLSGVIGEYNEIVGKVNAATGDKDSLVEATRDLPQFEDLRNQIAELEEALMAQVNEIVNAKLTDNSGDVESLTAQAKEKLETIKPGISFFKKLYGDEAAESLPKVDRLKGTRSGGGGGGGKRIRGYNWIVELNGEATEYENAATAAKALDLPTTALQEAFFAKAGVEVLKDAPDRVVLNTTLKQTDAEGNESEVTAVITAYRTAPEAKDEETATEPEAPVDAPDEDGLDEI